MLNAVSFVLSLGSLFVVAAAHPPAMMSASCVSDLHCIPDGVVPPGNWTWDGPFADVVNVSSIPRPMALREAMARGNVRVQDGGFETIVTVHNGSETLRIPIWIFGDTFLGCYEDTEGYCSIASGTADFTSPTAVYGSPSGEMRYRIRDPPLIPMPANWSVLDYGLWPDSAVFDEETHVLYILYSMVNRTANDSVLYYGVAATTLQSFSDVEQLSLQPCAKHTYTLYGWIRGPPNERFWYVYTTPPSDPYNVRVGRIDVRDMWKLCSSDLSFIRWWSGDGDSFTAISPEESPPVLKNVDRQLSVQYVESLSLYLLIHSGWISGDSYTIYLRTAKTPFGPFSKAQNIWTVIPPEGKGSERRRYGDWDTFSHYTTRFRDITTWMVYFPTWHASLSSAYLAGDKEKERFSGGAGLDSFVEREGEVAREREVLYLSYCQHIPWGPYFDNLLPTVVEVVVS